MCRFGVFCALISRLVSRGSASEGILGMKWELMESGVKRNLISFHIDEADHVITLIAHVSCYEIRVIRQDRSISPPRPLLLCALDSALCDDGD